MDGTAARDFSLGRIVIVFMANVTHDRAIYRLTG